jgi:hypothetical protein
VDKIKNFQSADMNYNVRIVLEGDSYGLNNVLIHKEPQPLVEFYDTRYKHTEHGQFVSRYYLDTLLERNQNYGLNLEGSVPDWCVNKDAMLQVTDWIKSFKTTVPTKKIKF